MASLPAIEIDSKTFLKEHCSLPALPQTLTRIQEIIRDPNADMATIVELISGDPSLLAQILKIVNSSYYGLPTEVSQVQFAVAFLGLNEVYRMALSLTVINTIDIRDKTVLDRFWFHSYYTALCSKYLAKKYEPQISFEDLWSSSVLHDIGKLVYIKFFPEHTRKILEYAHEKGCLYSEAIEYFSLPSDTYLGMLLCDHWRLPEKVKGACQHHRLEDLSRMDRKTSCFSFNRMVCLGNLAAILAKDDLNENVKQKLAKGIMKELDCSESEFLSLMGDIYDLKHDVEKFITSLN